jgi:DNA-binding transcriptional regulator YdaS (Cro superfamily)
MLEARLATVDDVIEAVGGTAAAAALAGVKPPAASNWRARGRIPPGKSMIFAEALKQRGKEANPSVFGLEIVEARA